MARKWNPSLHPRDKKGRFTRSAAKVMSDADRKRGRAAVQGAKPRAFTGDADRRAYLQTLNPEPPQGALKRYLDGDWRTTNTALRSLKKGAASPDGVDDIDQQMAPLPDDLLLHREVPLALFAHMPMPELAGLKVRDAAYASTSIDPPGSGSPDRVRMHILTPAGTPAVVNPADGEVLLARDTEVAITRVEPDGAGGWDVYGTVLPKVKPRGGKGRGTPAPADPAPAGPPAATASTQDQIRAAVDTIIGSDGGDDGDWVSITRLRALLPDVSRSDFDQAVRDLHRQPGVNVEGRPDRWALNQADHDAAVTIAGEPRHLIAIQRLAPEQPGGSPGGDPPEQSDLAAAPLGMDRRGGGGLTSRMRRHLSAYRDGSDRLINGALRNPDAEVPAAQRHQIAGIDEAMAASKLTAAVQVFRGVRKPEVMFGDRLSADLTGMVWREDAYVSSSVVQKVAQDFSADRADPEAIGMVMNISVPEGVGGVELSPVTFEGELLLDRGHEFRVTGDRGVTGGVRLIDVEVLPKGLR